MGDASYTGTWSQYINRQILADHDLWAHSKGGTRLELTGCRLDDMKGRGTQMIDARFVSCSFHKADLSASRFVSCSLHKADLSASVLDDLELEDCVLKGASLARSTLLRAIIYRCDLTGADLRLARLQMADIVECNFTKALLDRADLSGGILKESCLRGAAIYDATFNDTQVGLCDFREADLSQHDAGHLCTCEKTWFFRCDFRGANFAGRHLKDTRFTGCRFHGVRGKPIIDGPYTVERPNFAKGDDEEDLHSTEADLHALWGAPNL
jgi:uncharacterized protein YjbI with pentapeptide repeats